MVQIRIQVDAVRQATDARHVIQRLSSIRQQVSSFSYSVDARIAARKQLSSRLHHLTQRLNTLERRLSDVEQFVHHAMEAYEAVERALVQDAHAGDSRPASAHYAGAAYPNIPGVDWSKVPEGMKQQLLQSILHAEEQRYNIAGIDWGMVSPQIRDQLRASIDQWRQNRTAFREDTVEPPAQAGPLPFGRYDRDREANEVIYTDSHGRQTVIDTDKMTELIRQFNTTTGNVNAADILHLMNVDISDFADYVIAQGYDPRTFLPLKPGEMEAIDAYVQARKTEETVRKQEAREWQSELLGYMPGMGTTKDVVDLLVGKDILTGRELSGVDYAAAPLLMMGPLGKLLRRGGEAAADTASGIVRKNADDVVEGASKTMGNMINDIRTKTPDQLLKEGWQDVTDPRKAQNTMSREYYNPETGVKISYDPGKKGTTGFEAVDHYHIHNPNYTDKKVDYYFDLDGNPVGKASKASHIVIKEGE